MADAPSHRPDRRVNGSPPPAQSKRDKRRQMLADRLMSLSDKFSKDRDQAFREQLHKIQIDTTLIMRVDPYADRPLDSFEQDQQRLQQLNGEADNLSGPQTLLDRAGPRFSKWMEQIQDLVEQRDYAIAKYKVCLGSLSVCSPRPSVHTTNPPRSAVRLREEELGAPQHPCLQDGNREPRIPRPVADASRSPDQRHHEQEIPAEQGEGAARDLGLVGPAAAPQPVQPQQPVEPRRRPWQAGHPPAPRRGGHDI